VRSHVDGLAELALEPAERSDEKRCSARTVLRRDPVPHRDRRDTAGEVLREPLLSGREQRDRTTACIAQELVQRRLLRDREADEGGIEGEADERPDRETEPIPVRAHRHDDDAVRKSAHHAPEIGLGVQRGDPMRASDELRLNVVREPVPYPLSKRILDKSIAGGLFILAAPVLAAVCAAMGVDMALSSRDRGPWLYRERRISRGREFDLLKFRTLRREVLDREGGASGHARLFESDTDNLTWAGRRFLKPWYLDELPQLFNVLRGDMSLVGPRPWPVEMVADQVAAGLDYRTRAIAGWTGPAQVQKGVTETAGYTSLDLSYIESCRTWSSARLLRYDLRILRQTVKVIARGEGLSY
jgi:lipopolysaccharide/colanic/teichoic acid biosynthesis glycosyltransferase